MVRNLWGAADCRPVRIIPSDSRVSYTFRHKSATEGGCPVCIEPVARSVRITWYDLPYPNLHRDACSIYQEPQVQITQSVPENP